MVLEIAPRMVFKIFLAGQVMRVMTEGSETTVALYRATKVRPDSTVQSIPVVTESHSASSVPLCTDN